MLRTIGSICFAATLASTVATGQATTRPARIDVVANDYAFMPLPARIEPGPTLFTFANHGKVQHELALATMKPGVSADSVVKAVKAGGRPRDFLDRSVGILLATPTTGPDGQLYTELRKGVTYFLFCNFRDTPDAQTHLMMGMFTTFRVE
ncbi:MAG TPA: hypothetical protein VIH53_08430 [Gemmatimonadaceae bacterium]|jgi:hypothetical protein